jgi:hypothetical protein
MAFYENDAAPLAVMPSDVVTGADCAESGFGVQVEAGGVFGEDPGLDGPDPGRLSGADQRVEQGSGDAPAARVGWT